jgi:hypothetical protein
MQHGTPLDLGRADHAHGGGVGVERRLLQREFAPACVDKRRRVAHLPFVAFTHCARRQGRKGSGHHIQPNQLQEVGRRQQEVQAGEVRLLALLVGFLLVAALDPFHHALGVVLAGEARRGDLDGLGVGGRQLGLGEVVHALLDIAGGDAHARLPVLQHLQHFGIEAQLGIDGNRQALLKSGRARVAPQRIDGVEALLLPLLIQSAHHIAAHARLRPCRRDARPANQQQSPK